MPLTITALYAGILALLMLWLAVGVIGIRRSKAISLGDGGDELLGRRIRGHANATETIPIAIILLALTEVSGAPSAIVHLLGILLVVGRTMHGIHFRETRQGITLRFWGMLMTITAIALMAIGLIGHSLIGLF
ncbi:MAG: MAPEG family protein [Pseudomonadota bacterium]